MDREYRQRSSRRERESPSFSSTLLDSIYRSIDQGPDQDELLLYRETMKKKQYSGSTNLSNVDFGDDDRQALDNLRRACLIEKWMEKKVTEKVVVRRKSAADFERKLSRSEPDSSLFLKSSSSSSDSSSGGEFFSSEAESVYGVPVRPKPIRTSISTQPAAKLSKHETLRDVFGNHFQRHDNVYAQSQQKPKHEAGGFVKTKSRALKIYGDLKKVKQPISPGGKLATFLNSLFTAGNAKKAKISSSSSRGSYNDETERKSKSAHASTCSSASSFSRSCLSKTPSSRGKLSSNGMKRSVRFYPVSVIVDEDCQPIGHKSLYEDESNSSNLQAVKIVRNNINEELKIHLNEKNRRVEEAARDLLKNYQKKVECELDLRIVNNNGDEMDIDEDDDEDDDDAASYASSDLFELDNLSAIGIERYREELPVYGTTNFNTNRAIANGINYVNVN